MTTRFSPTQLATQLPGAPPAQAPGAPIPVNNPYGTTGGVPGGAGQGNPGMPTPSDSPFANGIAGSMTPVGTTHWDPNFGQIPGEGGAPNPATTSGLPPVPTPTEERRDGGGGGAPGALPIISAPTITQTGTVPTAPDIAQAPAPNPSTFSLDPITSDRELTPTTTGNIAAPTVPGVPDAPTATQTTFNPIQAQTAATTGPAQLGQAQAFTPQNVGVNRVNVGTDAKYADAAFANAMSDLQPMLDDRQAALQQNLVNRGLAVGSDAYNKAMESYGRSHADALSQAAFDAQRYGLQAQNQFFNQGMANEQLGFQADAFNAQQGLAAAQMGESQRQFDAGFGLQNNAQQFQQNFANAQMANAMDQFNASQGLAVDNANFGRDMSAANFNLNAANSDFNNQLGAANWDLAQQGQAFNQNLAANQLGMAQDAQNFNQNLASGQFNLAQNAQNWAQGMDAANFNLNAANSNFNNQLAATGMQNQMDQFASMFGLQGAQFENDQQQANANRALQEYLARMQRDAAYANSQPSMGQMNANQYNIDRNFDLQERQLMAQMLGMWQNGYQNWQGTMWG